MILIKKLILALFKLIILLSVITFEKVVGLPMIFITLLLIFFITERSFYRYIVLVIASLFLGLVYGLSFSLSILILVCLVLMTIYGKNIVTNDINRVLLAIYVSTIIIAFSSKVFWGKGVVVYFIISSLVMIVILMKTLFSKHGLAEKIVGKKSNFFR